MHFFVCFYSAISTYGILKYQLMDIRIAVTRLGVFVLVYSLVLGIPFGMVFLGREWLTGVMGEDWFWAPMGSLLVLATAGPFVYLMIQKKAEDRFLEEDRRIQRLLQQASYAMTTIHDLKELLDLITGVLERTLGVEGSSVYLLDPAGKRYTLRAGSGRAALRDSVPADEAVLHRLREAKAPLLTDEIMIQSEIHPDNEELKTLLVSLNGLAAHVVVPVMMNESLLGFLVLGERDVKEVYSLGLRNALSVLGNQAALAIENCNYIDEATRRIEEEGFQQRVASLDMMASSLAHEIDNPMGVILGQTGFLEELLRDPSIVIPAKLREMVDQSFGHITGATRRVSGMIRAILEYSRMGTGRLKPLRIDDVVTDFQKLIAPQFKSEKVRFHVDLDEDLPYILGSKIQLEEVLMNFSTNAVHALKDRTDKRAGLKVFPKDAETLRLEFSDNGHGIPVHLLKDIFLASVTTKGSSEGTGLGLFRIRKIIDLHHGEVWAESDPEQGGAIFIVELPVYKGDLQDVLEDRPDPSRDGSGQLF